MEEVIFSDEDIHGSVTTDQWMPNHKPLEYPKSFIRWINSMNKGWRNMVHYKPLELYVKQAQQWVDEDDDILNYRTQEEQEDYIVQEYNRCKENTLYFANKYGYLKEGSTAQGEFRYQAWKAQEILLFLVDCGYNVMIGKARQIGFTTTMGLAAMAKISFRKSFFCKFITHSRDKGEEIFRDKIRWGFGKIPDWLVEEPYNDAANQLSMKGKTKKKGRTEGSHSRIQVDTPAVDAINGGSPNLVMIDEIGLFELFGKMVREGRPTLFFFNPESGLQEMRRQLVCWGTGGEMDKGGAVFESEFKAALEAWRTGNYSYGIIPLFFDAYARQGMSDEMYKKEKAFYYSKTGVEQEVSKVQFHQHYPITLEDMFLRTARTILPVAKCNEYLSKIYSLSEEDQPQYGYFEPVYNRNSPTPHAVLPYKLVGATFVPTEGREDERTTAIVFQHPPNNEKWEYRYYQGTDPVNSETGHSKMSSSIWDAYTNTCSSMVFWRVRDYKQIYLQCVLQGLYYDQLEQGGVKELLEKNIGQLYYEFQEQVGVSRRLTANAILPPFLQTPASSWWGIRNVASTGGHISNKIIEMVDAYAPNIFIPWFFEQLKTFVEKELKGSQSHRQTRFQAADLKYDYDDGIFSMAFAYINAQAHSRFEPRRVDAEEESTRQIRLVQSAETQWRLKRALVNSNGKVIRYL
jgi:hypothetical protein